MRNLTRTDVLDFTLLVVELVRPLNEKINRHDKELACQIRRATNSVALNVSEGFGSTRGTQRSRFESSLGSALEARQGLRVAVAWGHVTAAEAREALDALERISRRLYGLSKS